MTFSKSIKYSILVNSCDKFSDCWHPFFKLLKIYWPDCKASLYLNTEKEDYSHQGMLINSTKVGLKQTKYKSHFTWSECLLKALDKIEDEIIIYMQEDYFLKAPVKNELVEHFVELIESDESIHCIHLTDAGPNGEAPSNKDKLLWTVPKIHRDRVSCQAAIWRKSVLREYIRSHESGWNFEWYGSKRAELLDHNFYTVDRNVIMLNKFEIIPYVCTGIIGGKWSKEVPLLFTENNINIDYTKREFFKGNKLTIFERIKSKIKRIPNDIRSNFDLFMMKYK